MLPIYLFDDGKGQLAPLTDLRASFDIRTGALTTLERAQMIWGGRAAGLFVPDRLAALTRERHPDVPVNEFPQIDGDVLLINGAWALCAAQEHVALTDRASGRALFIRANKKHLRSLVGGDLSGYVPHAVEGAGVLTRPWHVRTCRDAALRADLELLAGTAARPESATVIGDERLTISATARMCPGTILDVEHGPIVVAEGATVRPGAILIGPCYVGPHATVLERATIRGNTAIGPWCKVNGEVSGTIFQGYANKAHDGFLGDSWVGEWVNLGAGTTNSNLLNTYGEVPVMATPGGSYERSGEQFLGAIIGDHVKTAICTRIMTGAVIHTGAMLAQSAAVSGCVPPFAWATDAGVRRFRFEKFFEVMSSAMARRKIEPSAAYNAAIAALHQDSA